MSIPNPIPHKTLYINDYICSCYAFVFIFEFSEYISKHILQFHVSFLQLVKFEYIYMNNNCLTSEKVENIQLLIRII